ncbi:MAG: hypothetical protein NC907_05645, partial [Candidatus Omnitrophica bacterium]|nr:hypothetical protein [Candidatus Omnitrophota bacterium]
KIMIVAFLTGAVIIIYIFFLHRMFDVFLYHGRAVRTFISILAITPVGFLMGIPFPTGIRIVKQYRSEIIPWLWAINGFMSVCGSLLAVIIAKLKGFTITFFTGGLLYLLLFLVCFICVIELKKLQVVSND